MAEIAINEYGASREMRLDPYSKQHKIDLGSKSYKLDTNGAVVKKTLSCGLPMTIAVPTTS